MRYLLSSVLFSFGIVLLWGWGLLSYSSINTSILTNLTGLGATLLFLKYLEKRGASNKRVYLLILPLSYVILLFILRGLNEDSIINPIIPTFLLYAALIVPNRWTLKALFTGIMVILLFPYFHLYYPDWIDYKKGDSLDLEYVEKRNLNPEKIDDFVFLTLTGDRIKLDHSKSLIIETWQEDCMPCIQSMQDFNPLIDSLSKRTPHYYLYIPKSRKLLDLEKISSFEHIPNLERVIVDDSLYFYKKIGLQGVPHFLKFCDNGFLCDYFTGYNRKYKDYFEKRIIELFR